MRFLTRRLQAVFLALVFLGGGTSLPSLDVLLFHLHGEQSRATAHVEPAGGCTSHDGHCGVGCPAAAAGGLGAAVDTPIRDATTPTVAPRSLPQIPMPHAR